MKKSIINLRKQIEDCNVRITKIQTACKHVNVNKSFGANTGNYDPSCDVWWESFDCTDCGKYWTIYKNSRGEVCKTI